MNDAIDLSSASHVVYVLDDDESLRDAVLGLLRSADLETYGYASVEEFRASRTALPREGPGCVVLDVGLANLRDDRFETLETQLGVGLPVVLFSGDLDPTLPERAKQAGAIAFLPKPFVDQDLLDTIARAFEVACQRPSAPIRATEDGK